MEYFVVIEGRREGPLSTLQLRQRLREGEIRPESKVWRRGMANWLPLAEVDALATLITEMVDDRAAGRIDADPDADQADLATEAVDTGRATAADRESPGEPGYRPRPPRADPADPLADSEADAGTRRARLGSDPESGQPADRDQRNEPEAAAAGRLERSQATTGKLAPSDRAGETAGASPATAGKKPPAVPITAGEAHAGLPREARAVLRFLARMVDFGLVSMLISGYVYLKVDEPMEWLQQAENARFLALLLPACAIGYELLLVALIGSTPGKLFFGMRLMDVDRRPLTPGQAARRALGVWTVGMGLGISVLMLLLPLFWWFRFRMTGLVPWDQWSGLVVVHRPPSRGRLIAGLVVIMLLVWQTLAALAMQLGGG